MPLHVHLRSARGHGAPNEPNIGKLLLWHNFVGTAIGMLRHAEQQLNDPTVAAPFKARRGWHRKKARPDGRGGAIRIPDEDAITDALVELMTRNRAAHIPGSTLALYSNIGVFSQQKRRKQQGIGGKGRLNTDIAIYLADQVALDLRIEAKVLITAGDVSASYCSTAGLLRFADRENPYTTEWVGGMVAYCFLATGVEWDARIETAMGGLPDVTRVGKAAVTTAGATTEVLVADVANPCDVGIVSVFHISMEFAGDPVSP